MSLGMERFTAMYNAVAKRTRRRSRSRAGEVAPLCLSVMPSLELCG
jgi:hypothetical protein